MLFLVGFCFFRMENLALTSARTQMYWERRSKARVHQCCCISAVTFVFKTQFLAQFQFPGKFIIRRIWDRLLAIIRYIGKIWDAPCQKLKKPWKGHCHKVITFRNVTSYFFLLSPSCKSPEGASSLWTAMLWKSHENAIKNPGKHFSGSRIQIFHFHGLFFRPWIFYVKLIMVFMAHEIAWNIWH